jgi:AbrB family looped-hinge helix DNA binding protein
MKELLTVVTRKGQVTVPAEVRKALGLKQGDRVVFQLSAHKSGAVSMRRVGSVVDRTAGMLAGPGPALSPEEERAAAEQAWADDAVERASR